MSTYLICPPFDDTVPGEDLVGGFKLKSDLSLLEKNSKNLYLVKRLPLVKLKQLHSQLLEIDLKTKTGLGDRDLLVDLFVGRN